MNARNAPNYGWRRGACQLRAGARATSPGARLRALTTPVPAASMWPSLHQAKPPSALLKEVVMGRALTAVLALALAVGLAGAGDALAQTKEDTIVYAIQSDVQTWDPPNSVLRESIILGYHVFDHLAARDLKTRRVGPSLATAWKTIDDTTWEVKLRQGVKFHDGSPFTAKDVKASFERVLDPTKKMTARGNHAKIKGVDIVDDYTVRFRTDGPYPLFVERMTALVIHSEKALREKPHEWVQENPIGTGPYKLVRWNRKQEHLLVRNDDYWGAKPHFKHVRIRIIPEQATQIAELISGGVDIIKAVPPDQMDVIESPGRRARPARRSCARPCSSWTRPPGAVRTRSPTAGCDRRPTSPSTPTPSSSMC